MNLGQVLFVTRTFSNPEINIGETVFKTGSMIFKDPGERMFHVVRNDNYLITFRSFVNMNFTIIYHDLTIIRDGKMVLQIKGDVNERQLLEPAANWIN
jgi:hypothetical protein